MTAPTPDTITLTRAQYDRDLVDARREGYYRHLVKTQNVGDGWPSIHTEATRVFPYPAPSRSIREEPDPEFEKWSSRFVNGRIENEAGFGFQTINYRTASAARIALWHSLMTKPYKCDGCGAHLTETEEHTCP